ncbi:MAG: HXXEE domain-containing protein [bacterium]|nr:HXXEE domain-containing protein [bacterium]
MGIRAATDWLIGRWQWPYAGLFAAVLLLALVPLVYVWAGLVMAAIVVQLPVYMLHQFEEHHDDCFCRYVNRVVGEGLPVLSPVAAFVINSVGVWGVILVGIYLAQVLAPGYGTIAIDLGVVNGLLHVVVATVRREYNPGLWTSLALFFPIGGAALWIVTVFGGADVTQHVVGALVAIAIHIAIVAYAISRRRALAGGAANRAL